MSASFSLAEIIKATNGIPQGRLPNTFESISIDTRSLVPGALFVALKGESFDGHQFLRQAAEAGAGGAVVQRGKNYEVPKAWGVIEVDNTLTALGKIAQFHRQKFSIPLGVITGSNGKTTAKEMIGSILEQKGSALKTEGNLNNEIGVPLTLLRLESHHQTAIIEMGMNHAGELSRLSKMVQPQCALITQVSSAHLAGLGSVEEVAKAKGEIFHGLSVNGLAIANGDDRLARREALSSGSKVILYGRGNDATVRLTKLSTASQQGIEIELVYESHSYPVRLSFFGEHNAWNACGAFAMGIALGCSAQQCVDGLEAARPWKHRLNLLSSPRGYFVLDDCYNANPASVMAALETLRTLARGHRSLAVLGDMLELGEEEKKLHEKVGEYAIRMGVQAMAVFGPRSQAIFDAVSKTLGNSAIYFPETNELNLPELNRFFSKQIASGDVVLVKGSRGMKLERVVDWLMSC